MKNIAVLIIFLFSCLELKANYYYGPYPINVTQTTNGSQYRLELTCYDSTLAVTDTLYTSYRDSYTWSNLNGMVSYEGSDCGSTYNVETGIVIYDYLIHQFKTLYDVYDCDQEPYYHGNGAFFSITYYAGINQSDERQEAGYYDLFHHEFLSEAETGEDIMPPLVSFSFPMLHTNSNSLLEQYECYYFANPNGGYIGQLAGGFTDYGYVGSSILTAYEYNLSGGQDELSVSAADAQGGGSFYYENVDFTVSNDLYVVKDKTTNVIYMLKYDAYLHLWQKDSFPPGEIASWTTAQNVVGLKNTANNKVYGAVYNFDQHQWVIDSISTNSVTNLSVSNGTITWNNGTVNDTLGYDPNAGWGNSRTTLTPAFYINDVADTTCGNLIFIRDYSIGATGISVNYGGGITGGSNTWHLYKKNGSYQYNGIVIQDTVCYTVTNSLGSATSCRPVSCLFGLAKVNSPAKSFCVGDSLKLSANSAAGLSYQWQQNGVNIPGATDSVYTTITGGSFRCIISDACYRRTSNSLLITMHVPITNAMITCNKPLTLCSNTTGTKLTANPNVQGHTYQWRKNGITIPNTPGSGTLNITPSNDTYDCIITNSCGTDTSNTITFTVQPAPINNITAYPTAICPGDSVLLQSSVSSGYNYQWKRYSSNIQGATNSSYLTVQTGPYQCIVYDSVCSVTSGSISLSTNSNPNVVVTAFTPTTFCSPGSVTLNTYNVGSTYQWYKNGISLTGSTSLSYVATTAGSYQVKVTKSNGCDSTSVPVVVYVPCAGPRGGNGGNSTNRVTAESEYFIYPNPAHQKLSVEVNALEEEIIQQKIFDVLGKEILSVDFKNMAGRNSHETDVSVLKPGVYFVEIKSSKVKNVFKIVKE